MHFVNTIIQKLTDKFRIWYSLFSLYHLQNNRLMKRFNQILCEELAKVVKIINN